MKFLLPSMMHNAIFRCWSIWSSLRHLSRKKRFSHGGLPLKRHLRLLNSTISQLLDLCAPPPPHRFQHRWCRPLRLRTGHGTHRPHEARHCRHVHLLLLLKWHCNSLWHRLYLPNMAHSLRCLLHSVPPLPRLDPSVHR